MRGILAVARRELAERRKAWIAAGVASLLPVVAPLLPGFRRELAGDVRTAMAFALAGSFYVGLSLVLGASLVGRELAERRMGFDFSRPLSGFAVWAGKFLAASLLAFGSALLVLLPTAFLELPSLLRTIVPPPLVIIVAAALTFASIHAVHAVGLAVRSRSPLLLLDLALAGGLVVTVTAVAGNLAREHAMGARWRGLWVFALIACVAVVAASFASVARGRTEIRPAHRALSATLWGILVPATALFAVYGRWVIGASPNDIRSVEWTAAAPRGSWVTVFGPTRGRADYRPTFLLNTATGRFRKLDGSADPWSVFFSRDGTQAVWIERNPGLRSWELRVARLDGASAISLRTTFSFASQPTSAALSPDGRRIAVLEGRNGGSRPLLSVYEIASGRLLGSASVAGEGRLLFVEPDRVRVYSFVPPDPSAGEGPVEISEFRLPGKKLETTGRVDTSGTRVVLRAEPSGRRLIVHEFGGGRRESRLHDGRTGSLIAALSSGGTPSTRTGEFLSDGRIVVAEADREAQLRVFSSDGVEEMSVPLGPAGWISLAGEGAVGKVIVLVGPPRPARPAREATRFHSKILVVDSATGETRRIATDLSPVSAWAWWSAGDPSLTPSPGSDAVKLFWEPDSSLVRLDPVTGEQRKILAGKDRN